MTSVRAQQRAGTSSTMELSELLLLGYALVVPFGSAIDLPIPSPLDSMSSLVGALALAALALEFVGRADRRSLDHVGPSLWLLFLGMTALSWFWSIDRSATFDETVVLGSLVGLSSLAAARRPSERFLLALLRALSASGATTGVVAITQLATGTLADSGTGLPRFALVGNDPNVTAGAMLLPLASSIALATTWRSHRAHRIHLVAAGLALSGIVLTISRGGLLAVGVVVVVLLSRQRNRRLPVLVGVVVASAAILPFLPAAGRGVASTGRTSIWRLAVEGCDTWCWTGSGAGTFPLVHESIALTRPELAPQQLQFEAHNIFIGTAVELGILTSLLVVGIFAVALAIAHHARNRFGAAALAGLLGVLVANLLVSNLGFKYVWLALLTATLAGVRPYSNDVLGDRVE